MGNILCVFLLIGAKNAAYAQKRYAKLHQHGQRRHRAGNDRVKLTATLRARKLFCTAADAYNVNPNTCRHGAHGVRLFPDGIKQRHFNIRARDFKRHAGNASARTHIQHMRAGRQYVRCRKTVGKMLLRRRCRLGDRRQVELPVCANQRLIICSTLLKLPFGQPGREFFQFR